jgi:hypothetical protein
MLPAVSFKGRATDGEFVPVAGRVVVAVNNTGVAYAGTKKAAAERHAAIAILVFKNFPPPLAAALTQAIVSE